MNTLCTVLTLGLVFIGKSVRNMSSPTEKTMFKVKAQKKVLKLVNFYAKTSKPHQEAAIKCCSAKKVYLKSRQNP